MRDGDRSDLGKVLLGAAVLGLAAGLRGFSGGKRKPGPSFVEQVRHQTREAAERSETKVREEIAKLKERRERIGDGAHDPGAVIIVPRPDDDIVVAKYSRGSADDKSNGTFLSGSMFGGYLKARPSWSLHERTGNYPCLAHIHGHFSEGWREDVGPAIAVTVTHCHRDGYFPYRDSLYADELPLDRIAAMLQGTHHNPDVRNQYAIVVIDNREAHRAEHARLAAGESDDVIRFRNWRGPVRDALNVPDAQASHTASSLLRDSAVVIFGEPGIAATYDPATKTLHGNESGLDLSIKGAGDRDYPYQLGIVRRAGEEIATVTLHTRDCWRPGYGPCKLINLNRAYRSVASGGKRVREDVGPAELPFEPVAALLNAHPTLYWNEQHLGHAVLVDSRAEPLNYYYG